MKISKKKQRKWKKEHEAADKLLFIQTKRVERYIAKVNKIKEQAELKK